MARKKSDFDWLVEKLKIISDLGQKVKDDEITTDYGYHTALKIITLHYVSDVFTNVARDAKREIQGFDGAVYVDLFAGTGLVKVGKTKDIVAGSALCAVKSGKGFTCSVMVEKDERRYSVLKNRMAKILHKSEFHIINGDANEVIEDVIDIIGRRFSKPIVLVFADPEGMEIKFKTLKAISDKFQNCDFVINVNAQGALRVAGQTKHGIPNRVHTLEEYLEDDAQTILRELAEGKPMEKKYAEQVQNILGKQVGEVIRIRGDGGKTAYYLLCYTRMTRGGSRYSKAYPTLKRRIEQFDGDRVRKALDQAHGRSTKIDDFLR